MDDGKRAPGHTDRVALKAAQEALKQSGVTNRRGGLEWLTDNWKSIGAALTLAGVTNGGQFVTSSADAVRADERAVCEERLEDQDQLWRKVWVDFNARRTS